VEPLEIYVVRGTATALKQFHAEVARDWQGGQFLPSLSSGIEYRYWAYPSRTAPQARVFIFGTMNNGVRLDFEEYQETTYYPRERVLLNSIASRCRLESASLLIEPDRTVVMTAGVTPDSARAACVRRELAKSQMPDISIRFEAAKKPGERG
jgi:hypothetical protein